MDWKDHSPSNSTLDLVAHDWAGLRLKETCFIGCTSYRPIGADCREQANICNTNIAM